MTDGKRKELITGLDTETVAKTLYGAWSAEEERLIEKRPGGRKVPMPSWEQRGEDDHERFRFLARAMIRHFGDALVQVCSAFAGEYSTLVAYSSYQLDQPIAGEERMREELAKLIAQNQAKLAREIALFVIEAINAADPLGGNVTDAA